MIRKILLEETVMVWMVGCHRLKRVSEGRLCTDRRQCRGCLGLLSVTLDAQTEDTSCCFIEVWVCENGRGVGGEGDFGSSSVG